MQNFVVPGKPRSKRKRLSAPRTNKDPLSIWSHHLNPQIEALCSDPPLLKQAYWLADSELIMPKPKDKEEQQEEVVIMAKDDEEKVIINVSKEISFGDSELDEGSNGQQQPMPNSR